MMNGNKLPPVKRCRDYHLYDYKGNRFLDLYLDAGRAIMGHKPGKTMLPIKNSLEKGIWAAYPSVYENRLVKVVQKMFPSQPNIALFSNRERAEKAVSDYTPWKPLLENNWSGTLLIEPPLPGINQTVIVCSDIEVPEGDTISPVLLEGMLRNFHDFTAFKKKVETSIWSRFDDLESWERKGPYLTFRGVPSSYEAIFDRALEKRVFLSPEPTIPSIIPALLSANELKTLLTLFKEDSP